MTISYTTYSRCLPAESRHFLIMYCVYLLFGGVTEFWRYVRTCSAVVKNERGYARVHDDSGIV
jgi:hypothetical protein